MQRQSTATATAHLSSLLVASFLPTAVPLLTSRFSVLFQKCRQCCGTLVALLCVGLFVIVVFRSIQIVALYFIFHCRVNFVESPNLALPRHPVLPQSGRSVPGISYSASSPLCHCLHHLSLFDHKWKSIFSLCQVWRRQTSVSYMPPVSSVSSAA